MFKWLSRMRGDTPPKPDLSTELSRQDAARALADAEQSYSSTIANGERVDEVVEKLRLQREKNHFGYLLEQTMRGADRK